MEITDLFTNIKDVFNKPIYLIKFLSIAIVFDISSVLATQKNLILFYFSFDKHRIECVESLVRLVFLGTFICFCVKIIIDGICRIALAHWKKEYISNAKENLSVENAIRIAEWKNNEFAYKKFSECKQAIFQEQSMFCDIAINFLLAIVYSRFYLRGLTAFNLIKMPILFLVVLVYFVILAIIILTLLNKKLSYCTDFNLDS